MAKSLLHMISNDIGQLACLYAKLHGLDRVYFGGFFIRGHPVTMRTITYSINFFSKVTVASFLSLGTGVGSAHSSCSSILRKSPQCQRHAGQNSFCTQGAHVRLWDGAQPQFLATSLLGKINVCRQTALPLANLAFCALSVSLIVKARQGLSFSEVTHGSEVSGPAELGSGKPEQPCIVGLPLRFLSHQATLWHTDTICQQGIGQPCRGWCAGVMGPERLLLDTDQLPVGLGWGRAKSRHSS